VIRPPLRPWTQRRPALAKIGACHGAFVVAAEYGAGNLVYDQTIVGNNEIINYTNFVIAPNAKSINVDATVKGNHDTLDIFVVADGSGLSLRSDDLDSVVERCHRGQLLATGRGRGGDANFSRRLVRA
jgi:hypothetical protein